jgi:signal transduction histidine kinase
MSENPSPVRVALRALGRTLGGEDYPPPRPDLRWPRLWSYARPLGLLLLIGICAATVQYFAIRLPIPAAWLFGLLSVAPVPLLFRWPLWAWRLSVLGLLVSTFNAPGGGPPWSATNILVSGLALIVIATRVEPTVAVWIGLLTLVPAIIFLNEDELAFTAFLVAVILLAGNQVGRLRHTRQKLAAQTEVSELEQARRAVLEERARIARELHDVVAHHMSLIAVRAETAPYRLGGLPEPARDEFAAVAQASREALAEMRRLLGVLRSESVGPELAPQPDLSAIGDLVAAARRAGMSVHYLPPEPEHLERPPGAVALAGFRIVQEALANATRHAPGAAVTVQIWPSTRELSVRVHNDPPPGRNPDDAASVAGGIEDGVGHGVAGMRERATLLGGEFSAGPTGDGGFAVAATMPYGDDDRP